MPPLPPALARVLVIAIAVVGVSVAIGVGATPKAIGDTTDYRTWAEARSTSHLDGDAYRGWVQARRAHSVRQKVVFGIAGAVLVFLAMASQLRTRAACVTSTDVRSWLAPGAGTGALVAGAAAGWLLWQVDGSPDGGQWLGAFILTVAGVVTGSLLALVLLTAGRRPTLGVAWCTGLWIMAVHTLAAYHAGWLDTRFDLYRSLRVDLPWSIAPVLLTLGLVAMWARWRAVDVRPIALVLALGGVGTLVAYALARPTLSHTLLFGWDRVVPGVSGAVAAGVGVVAWSWWRSPRKRTTPAGVLPTSS